MEAIGPKVLLGGVVDHPDGEHVFDCTRQPSCNTGDGIRAIHYWTKELLTQRQDYELSNGGFGRGQGKTLSDELSGEQRVNSSAAANNAECGSGETSCLDKWIYDLSALRSRIE
ncbi:hypothetical protein HanPI659440_Chr02g0049461 [Helianthus annuus]|nr:hypothetical protein HanPI659440_Chr02g0049461 [Helianthus annuus]